MQICRCRVFCERRAADEGRRQQNGGSEETNQAARAQRPGRLIPVTLGESRCLDWLHLQGRNSLRLCFGPKVRIGRKL